MAFEQGRAAIHLEGLPDAERPQLKVRVGLDATQLIPAVVAPLLRIELPCPYPGMRPYTADDAAGFHGREAEIDEMIGRLRAGDREIYVIGPSGSGKSSLVAAGVLPRLARGVAGLGPLVVRTMRPGEQPATQLYEALDHPPGQPFEATDCIARLLAHRSRDSSVLFIVDQFEELFTLASVGERGAFLAALRALRAEPRFVVIVTLRADFFGALMESPLWPERGREKLSHIEVGPLRGEALREAITVPACDTGVVVESDLIERLLADTASEPGILPLLQETMVQLWDKRTDQTLRLVDYQALGDGSRSGLAVAVARRADATLRTFTEAQTEVARRLLLRMISFGEGRSDTRRQQSVAQLRTASDDTDDFAFVLQEMVDNRLLTMDEDDRSGEPRVDLAHEVMIAAWPTLAGWIRRYQVDEQKRRQLEATVAQWNAHGRGERGLLDQYELAEAEAWLRSVPACEVGQSADVAELIEASRRALARWAKVKADFISIAAHELRTPLTSIVGYLDLFQEGRFGELPPQIGRPLSSVRRNAHRLNRLVNDMLDVSRIEQGRMPLRRERVNLGEVVSDVVTDLEPRAKTRDLHVATHIREVEPIDADRDKLHQIAFNLVTNAIRYTPEQGEILVDVDEAPSERYHGGWARLRVRYNGVGIAEEDRARIFDPFLHLHPAKHHTSALPDSAGLGLFIAKGLVDAHGGLITVDSQPDVFTEFTVLLPFRAHQPSTELT